MSIISLLVFELNLVFGHEYESDFIDRNKWRGKLLLQCSGKVVWSVYKVFYQIKVDPLVILSQRTKLLSYI